MPTTTSTSSNPFYDIIAPYLSKPLQRAQSLYDTGQLAPAYYPGETVAGFDPTRAQGINLGVQAGLGPQQQLADAYTSGLLGIAQGTDPTTQRLATQAAAASAPTFAGAGTIGGARHAQAANKAAADAIANRQLSALSRIPSAQAAALQPGKTLADAGSTFQDYQQAQIDADRKRYAYNVGRPTAALQQYQELLGYPNVASYAPTTTTSTEPSGVQSAIDTGLGNLAGSVISGLGSSILGGFGFAGGGEIPSGSVSPRYKRAKMRKMGGR